jgi:hypothetical protein
VETTSEDTTTRSLQFPELHLGFLHAHPLPGRISRGHSPGDLGTPRRVLRTAHCEPRRDQLFIPTPRRQAGVSRSRSAKGTNPLAVMQLPQKLRLA